MQPPAMFTDPDPLPEHVPADVRAVVRPVLRHRLFTNFNADAAGVDVDQILDRLLQIVAEPSYGEPGLAGTARAK